MNVPSAVAPALPADAFSLTPDPTCVFSSRQHAEALATLKRGLEERRGIQLAVAEVGMGKTTLAYALLSSLGKDVRTAYVANPRLPFDGLVRHALADFGVRSEGRDRANLLSALAVFLEECAAWEQVAVLVIDEAQSLDDGTFEDMHLLLDLETGARASLQIILVGQPELDGKLRQPRLRDIASRVAARVELKPLDREESRRYVAHRLELSGGAIGTFSDAALDLILGSAQGVPRRMNVLCHNALLLAYAAEATQVTPAMAREAIHELAGGTLLRLYRRPAGVVAAARDSRLARWSSAAVAMVAFGAFLGLEWRQRVAPPLETRRPSPVADLHPVARQPEQRPVAAGVPDVSGQIAGDPSAPASAEPPAILAHGEPDPTPPAATPSMAPREPAPSAPEAEQPAAAPARVPAPAVLAAAPTRTADPVARAAPPPAPPVRVLPAATIPTPLPERGPKTPGEADSAPAAPSVAAAVPVAAATPPPRPVPRVEPAPPPPVQIARSARLPVAAVPSAPPAPPPALVVPVAPAPAERSVEAPPAVTPRPAPEAASEPPPPVQLARAPLPPPLEPPSASPPPASAAPMPGVSDADVRALLDRYVRAWDARDVTELRRIGQIADDEQARAFVRYFDGVRDLAVKVQVLEMSGSGDRRTVRFTRRDRFRDPAGHEVSKESPPIEKTIVRTPEGLKFAPRS